MFNSFVRCFIVLTLLFGGISCTKLGEPGVGEHKLVIEKLTAADSIPLKWGKLVSVSSTPGINNWVQLWFQDDEGTIRTVPYDVGGNYLSRQARVIRRD
jgi:hypothetical protein